MGAKKLKAIAIRGSGKIGLADPEAFRHAAEEQVGLIKASQALKAFSVMGTQAPECTMLIGAYPTRNFQEGVLPNWESLEAESYTRLRVRKTGCYRCMVRCGNITKMSTGKYAGAWSEGPEYETLWAFTGSIGVADIGLTIVADKLCDDLGLDTISTGNAIGFAYELYQRGILTKKDTEGLELNFGKEEPVLELIRKKPQHVELILTGRYADKKLIEIADLATEMVKIKHPYDQGIPSRVGIDC